MLQLKALLINQPVLATISVLSIKASLSIHGICEAVPGGGGQGREGEEGMEMSRPWSGRAGLTLQVAPL